MIFFFQRGTLHLIAHAIELRSERLALIQALCGDLTSMIHAHQPGSVFAFRITELGGFDIRSGICAFRGVRTPGNRAQRIVESGDELIEGIEIA